MMSHRIAKFKTFFYAFLHFYLTLPHFITPIPTNNRVKNMEHLKIQMDAGNNSSDRHNSTRHMRKSGRIRYSGHTLRNSQTIPKFYQLRFFLRSRYQLIEFTARQKKKIYLIINFTTHTVDVIR